MQTQWTSSAKFNNGSEIQRSACSIPSLQRHIKKKCLWVSFILYVFSIWYTLLCMFLYHPILAARITFLQVIFANFFCSFQTFLTIYRLWRHRYSKKLVSLTDKDISDPCCQLIYSSLLFYGSGFGCQNSSKMTPFRPRLKILWHNAKSLEL